MKIKQHIFALLFLVLTIAFSCGGTNRQLLKDIKLREVEEENINMRRAIARMDSIIREQSEAFRSLKADTKSEIADVQERMLILENRMKDSEDHIAQLSQRIDSVKQIVSKGGAGTGGGYRSSSRGAAFEPKLLYDTAYLDMVKGDYDLAILGFREYINLYPKSELADNAQYWIGECYYAQGKREVAIEEFKKVVSNYPNENKVSSALFKIGKSYYEMRRISDAKKYFSDLVRGYSNAEEAALAREYLNELGGD